MAAKAEETVALPAATPIGSSDPVPDPAAHRIFLEKGSTESYEREKDKAREDLPREAKRRRMCPAALETTTAAATLAEKEGDATSGAVGAEFSFSFDTRGVRPIETTPKFGSFCFPAADLALGSGVVVTKEDAVAAEGGGAEDGDNSGD
ncbi:hypothetical protein Cni_G04249 [Canna indica]|uniref:Uncharacterized protein n=1 Tax=Canna indica TaxID=4628 RepID=A0AAQ3Q4B2_9LILI|nr:hypothetical protein Cni_G04249 [Canna indica]